MFGQGRPIRWLFILTVSLFLPRMVAWADPGLWDFDLQVRAEEPTPSQDDATIRDIQFVGSRIGWAVGDRGTIWRTRDAGASWNFIAAPMNCSLQSVCFLTDRVGWIVGGGTTPFTRTDYGVVLFTSDGGQTWEHRAPDTLPPLYHVQFFDLQSGIAVGSSGGDSTSGVFVTADGGETWKAHSGQSGRAWRAADFHSTHAGVVSGRNGRVANVGGKDVLAQQFGSFGLRSLNDVRLQKDRSGWLVGDGALALTTDNEGVVWKLPPNPLPAELADITDFQAVAVNGAKAWIAGSPGSVIWHTQDRGQSWVKQPTGQTVPIHAIEFSSETNGVAAGALGLLLTTEDGGATWNAAHGGERRVAMMTIHARNEQVSCDLLAKYSGELGYRSLVAVTPRHDTGPDAVAYQDNDLRLSEAASLAGGSATKTGWRLPVEIPGIENHSERLVADWQRQTENRLQQVLVGGLVAQLRTWRPSIVIIDQPTEGDSTTEVLNEALLAAVEQAADPTRFIQQREQAELPPWEVGKVYVKLLPGSTGNSHLDTTELLPRLGKTVSTVATPAYGILLPKIAPAQQREAYRLIVDNTAPLGAQLKSGSLFTGLPISADSDARRELLQYDERLAEQRRKTAQRQKTFRAVTDNRLLNNAQHGMRLIAELEGLTRDLPDEQAALELSQLAEKYREQSRWDLAESTLVELVQKHPNQPVSRDAMRWLFQFWSSAETAWQRSRKVQIESKSVRSSAASVAQNIQRAIAIAQVPPSHREIEQASFENDPFDIVEQPSRLKIDENQDWRQGAVKNWHDQAIQMAKLIQRTSPRLIRSPQMRFPLASLMRQRGVYRSADSIYQSVLGVGTNDPWQATARAETWLGQPVDNAPKPMIICRETRTRPVLDGVLSDECWQQAQEIRLSNSVGRQPDGGEAAPLVMLAYDQEHLYVAASMPRVDGMPIDGPNYEGRHYDADLSQFDRVALYLDVDRDYATYYELVADQRGWTADTCWGDAEWNPHWFVAAHGDETHWRVEAAIPFTEMTPQTPKRNYVWSVGIVRILPAIGMQSWTQPAGETPRPETFGLVRFD